MAPKKYVAKDYLRNLFTFEGTAFKAVLIRPDWLFFLIYGVFLAILRYAGVLPDESELDISGEITIFSTLTFMLTFLLVFFLKECYDRYRRQLKHVIGAGGKIKELAMIAQAAFASTPQCAETVVRLCNAANHLFYYELSGLPFALWDELLVDRRRLLTQKELDVMQGYPGKCYLLCLQWALGETHRNAMKVIELERNDHRAHVVANQQAEATTTIIKLRRMYSAIELDESFQTIPFPYYHFLCVLLYLYLLALGFFANYKYSADTPFPLFLIIYMFTVMGLLALFHLALEFADPFGTDDNDIQLDAVLASQLKASQELLWDETSRTPEALAAWDFGAAAGRAAGAGADFLPAFQEARIDRKAREAAQKNSVGGKKRKMSLVQTMTKNVVDLDEIEDAQKRKLLAEKKNNNNGDKNSSGNKTTADDGVVNISPKPTRHHMEEENLTEQPAPSSSSAKVAPSDPEDP
mmetsp:Transcript_12199/g.19606  ORF Transcript_12199/g.19606 Transcript_12199/m.19606 type:complete len:466 (+) Transcript_12199:183-1580(+)